MTSDFEASVTAARLFLDKHWNPDCNRFDCERQLVEGFGLDRRQAALLLAEKSACHRVRTTGLGVVDITDTVNQLLET